MLDKLLSTLQEYVNEHKKLDEALHKEDETNKKWYKEGVRFEKLGQLKQVHYDSCKILHADYKEKVEEIFKAAYADLRSASMAPVDQDVLNNIKLMEEINDISQDEADALFETTKNSYLANKKVKQFVEKIGRGQAAWEPYIKALYSEDPQQIYFIPVDRVKSGVVELQDYVMDGIFGNSNKDFSFSSYKSRNIIQGDFINKVKSQGDHFIKRYLQQ